MKKILSINGTSFYSTGNIIKELEENLSNVYDFYKITADGNGQKNFKNPSNYLERQIGKIICQSIGSDGFGFKFTNRRVTKYIESVSPDLIHIHNVHGYWINLENIVRYARNKNVPIIYTLHDCWTFTGRCAHFFDSKCFEWKIGCKKCEYKSAYPRSRFLDFTAEQWKKKKELLTGNDIIFVSPSFWLKTFFSQSFLKNELIFVINNAIDCRFFSKVKKEKVIETQKKIVLSIANPFTPEKGLVEINQLSEIMSDDYLFVCVGNVQNGTFSKKIVNIPATKDKELLAKLYKQAHCFCLFSHQENYPTVLMEAIACGTPIITYDIGGCKEICNNGTNGYIVEKFDYKQIINAIGSVKKLNRETIVQKAQKHNLDVFSQKYRDIYEYAFNLDKKERPPSKSFHKNIFPLLL